MKKIFIWFGLYLVLVTLIVFLSNWRLNFNIDQAYDAIEEPEKVLTFSYGYNLDRWDASWYQDIVDNGYSRRKAAFFPLYPFLIRAVSPLTGSFAAAAAWLSLIATIAVVYFLYKFVHLETKDQEKSSEAVKWLLFFPTSFFLLAPYTESLFLALLLMALYFWRQERFLGAAITGFFLGLSRLSGVLAIILFLPELIRIFKKKDFSYQRLLAAGAPLGGLLVYLVYLKIKFNDWLAFVHSQVLWDRNFSLQLAEIFHRWQVYFKEWPLVFSQDNLAPLISRASDVVFLLLAATFILLIYFKWNKIYAIWMAAMLALPLLSGTLLSMPRYAMSLPFIYMYLGAKTPASQFKNLLFICFIVFWTLFLTMFSAGYWVA